MTDAELSTILIVDDDLYAREALSELFRDRGYETACADNGLSALNEIQTRRTLPGLILVDLFMPVMDGLTFLRRLRVDRRTEKIPAIVMTADLSATPLGADAVLHKPLNLELLLRTIGQFVMPVALNLNRR
jgi:CheY-like chemotaxis protein